jgi:hypothetical protein
MDDECLFATAGCEKGPAAARQDHIQPQLGMTEVWAKLVKSNPLR